ncbi:MAG: PIN domain-containing protein [Chloroflexi bacterium]|nr:MAG: PIN domain-containing protein [Chloroflexota bacterium]
MSSTTTNLEPFYVVDTHALIWYLLNDKKLSSSAKSIFQAAEQNQTLLIISAIVMAELYYANAKHKWFADFAQLYADITSKPYIRFMPVDHTHIPDFVQDAAVPEMHDRIIAGVARRLGAPLISSDPLITTAAIVTIVW